MTLTEPVVAVGWDTPTPFADHPWKMTKMHAIVGEEQQTPLFGGVEYLTEFVPKSKTFCGVEIYDPDAVVVRNVRFVDCKRCRRSAKWRRLWNL